MQLSCYIFNNSNIFIYWLCFVDIIWISYDYNDYTDLYIFVCGEIKIEIYIHIYRIALWLTWHDDGIVIDNINNKEQKLTKHSLLIVIGYKYII